MFTGYSDRTVDLFWNIRFNNDREWFRGQKDVFTRDVMQPTRELAAQLHDWFTQTYPQLHLNLHISRIYRDARRLFGRGPLNDHLWLSFQNEIEGYAQAPCFWFEIGCEGYRYGMGYWMRPADAARWRREIDRDLPQMQQLAERFAARQTLTLGGEEYARSKGHAGELIEAWYNKRSFSLFRDCPYDARSYSEELVPFLEEEFTFLMPYYEFADRVYRMAE